MFFSKQDFLHNLYDEHIFECGSLISDVISYFEDPEISWLDVHDLGRRLLAHADAIDLGGEFAQYCLRESLVIGDYDETLGAIYAISSQENLTDSAFLLEKFGEEINPDVMAIFFIGFKYASCIGLSNKLLPLLRHQLPEIRAVILETLGYRADITPRRIWPLFHDKDESVKLAAMVACMRLGFKEALPAMEQAVLEKKEIFNEHTVFPLLMLGSQKALQFSRRACQSATHVKPQYPIYLALSGNKDDIEFIVKALKFDGMNLAVLEALGIYGALEGVNTLMKFLSSEDDEEKLAAAKSLNQISGAQLYEAIAVIEKDDDDIDAETITGKPAASGEEKTAGEERKVEIKQDCTEKKRWLEWWQNNKSRFDVSVRYRHGKPYTFLLLLEEIAHPETKFDDRQRAYNELVIRSGQHIAFQPDWFVDKQIDALKKWQTWWNKNKSTFINQWMFDGA